MHGKRGKIIGRRELWGANRRPVNQPPIIIDTGSTSLPFLSQRVLPRSSAAIHRPLFVPESPRCNPLQPTPCRPRASTPYLLAARHPTTWRDKRTADTIIYFANVLQNCRYSFSVQSIQFSAPRVRPDGRAHSSVQSCDGFIVSRRHDRTDQCR